MTADLCEACDAADGQPAVIGPDVWSSICPTCTDAMQRIEDESWGGKVREIHRELIRIADSIDPAVGAAARKQRLL